MIRKRVEETAEEAPRSASRVDCELETTTARPCWAAFRWMTEKLKAVFYRYCNSVSFVFVLSLPSSSPRPCRVAAIGPCFVPFRVKLSCRELRWPLLGGRSRFRRLSTRHYQHAGEWPALVARSLRWPAARSLAALLAPRRRVARGVERREDQRRDARGSGNMRVGERRWMLQ